jgi:hypothetical protein
MTEAEWFAGIDPDTKLSYFGPRGTDRKLRLLAVFWCRQMEEIFITSKPHHHSVKKDRKKAHRNVVSTAERYADGEATKSELNKAYWNADRFLFADCEKRFGDVASAERSSLVCVHFSVNNMSLASDRRWLQTRVQEQAAALHEIFGNLFRQTAFDPAWRTSDVMALAKGIYHDRAFDRMPILADALQDAGCENTDILNHLRDPNATHVRGCWALDLVLEKC